jgi:hypothetical protein
MEDSHAAMKGNMWVMRAISRHWTAQRAKTGGKVRHDIMADRTDDLLSREGEDPGSRW